MLSTVQSLSYVQIIAIMYEIKSLIPINLGGN